MPCGDSGELDCRCKDAVAIFAADRGAASQCLNRGKKPTYRIFCDKNGNGIWDDGEEQMQSKIKCISGQIKRENFGTFSC